MAVAINWYEILLPSNVLHVPTQQIAEGQFANLKLDATPYRTVQRRNLDGSGHVYHLTDCPPDTAAPMPLSLEAEPTVVNALIEAGFLACLQEHEFIVNVHHVGGSGYYRTDLATKPEVYVFLKGLSFKAYFGFGSHPPRWGLILSYQTSQRFMVTLADAAFRDQAIGRRVVPKTGVSQIDETGHEVRSGTLRQVDGHRGVVVRAKGDEVEIRLDEWTMPCRKEILSEYLRRRFGEAEATRACRQLDQDGCLITPQGRMNTFLARDQIRGVESILRQYSLCRFQLTLPSRPPVSLVDSPLRIATPA